MQTFSSVFVIFSHQDSPSFYLQMQEKSVGTNIATSKYQYHYDVYSLKAVQAFSSVLMIFSHQDVPSLVGISCRDVPSLVRKNR